MYELAATVLITAQHSAPTGNLPSELHFWWAPKGMCAALTCTFFMKGMTGCETAPQHSAGGDSQQMLWRLAAPQSAPRICQLDTYPGWQSLLLAYSQPSLDFRRAAVAEQLPGCLNQGATCGARMHPLTSTANVWHSGFQVIKQPTWRAQGPVYLTAGIRGSFHSSRPGRRCQQRWRFGHSRDGSTSCPVTHNLVSVVGTHIGLRH